MMAVVTARDNWGRGVVRLRTCDRFPIRELAETSFMVGTLWILIVILSLRTSYFGDGHLVCA